jgi:hypothetical protein
VGYYVESPDCKLIGGSDAPMSEDAAQALAVRFGAATGQAARVVRQVEDEAA